MPYNIQSVGGGYKVVTKAGPHRGHAHSKRPLTRQRAEAQRRAIYANTSSSEPHNPTGDEAAAGGTHWVNVYGKKIDAQE